MSFITLGSRWTNGVLDTTGNNAGNWTVTFDPVLLNVTVALFEVQKCTIHSGKPGASFQVFIDNTSFTQAVLDTYGKNEWEPTTDTAWVLRSGQYVYFYMSNPATDGMTPTITIWLKYDNEINANKVSLAAGGSAS